MTESGYPDDIQFAGLVQAATAAADQEGQWPIGSPIHGMQHGDTDRSFQVEAEKAYSTVPPDRSHKRKHDDIDELPQGQYVPIEHSAELATGLASNDANDQSPGGSGVAATLFRQPTEKSKRYTRPPMSTLYTSLQLAPESFLRLQAAAKDFMLDENYPVRRDCVGQRGAGENADMVKLKLWKCVKEFLDDHGHGERYWGRNSANEPDRPARNLFWPRDMDAIIKLCVPLLRRMVTNERQRKYAAVARKSSEHTDTGSVAQDMASVPQEMSPVSVKDRGLLEIPDILSDGYIPDRAQLSNIIDRMAHVNAFQGLLEASFTDDSTFQHLIANIISHLEGFHGGDYNGCGPGCKQAAITRLEEWLQQERPERSIDVSAQIETATLSRVFDTCKQVFQHSSQSHTARAHNMANSNPSTVPALRSSKRSTRNASTTAANEQSNGAQGTTKSNLTIMVNIISNESSAPTSSKRVVPRFLLTPESATNLATLQAEVNKRYSAVTPMHIDGGTRLNVKVWLPDGLVQVKDDGEWMIALLSAGMVEWMDGEVRVVIEV